MRAVRDGLTHEAEHLRQKLPATACVECVARDRTAVSEVTAFAAEMSADLIALGRGVSGPSQAFIVSVAGDLLRSLSCDELMVPPAASAA
jgi:nucleotide-binding universal stress UspA family protein